MKHSFRIDNRLLSVTHLVPGCNNFSETRPLKAARPFEITSDFLKFFFNSGDLFVLQIAVGSEQ